MARTHLRQFPIVILAAALLIGAGCASQKETAASALLHFKKGNEAYRLDDYARAIRHYRNALELDPRAGAVHYNLGLAYFQAGDYGQAVGSFQRALAYQPRMADAHFNLAIAYDRLYQADAAHAHYNTYVTLTAGKPGPAATPGAVVPTSVAPTPEPARRPGATAPTRPSGARRPTLSPAPTARQGNLNTARQGRLNTGGRRERPRQRSFQRGSAAPRQIQRTPPVSAERPSDSRETRKWWIQDGSIPRR